MIYTGHDVLSGCPVPINCLSSCLLRVQDRYIIHMEYHNGCTLRSQGRRGGCAGLVDLPWNRVGVWAVVIWFMYSLKDFFGVNSWDQCPTSDQQMNAWLEFS